MTRLQRVLRSPAAGHLRAAFGPLVACTVLILAAVALTELQALTPTTGIR